MPPRRTISARNVRERGLTASRSAAMAAAIAAWPKRWRWAAPVVPRPSWSASCTSTRASSASSTASAPWQRYVVGGGGHALVEGVEVAVDKRAFVNPDGVAPRVVELEHVAVVADDDQLVGGGAVVDAERDGHAEVDVVLDGGQGVAAAFDGVDVQDLVVPTGRATELVVDDVVLAVVGYATRLAGGVGAGWAALVVDALLLVAEPIGEGVAGVEVGIVGVAAGGQLERVHRVDAGACEDRGAGHARRC